MAENDRGFVGSIPALYDRLLVPLIFQSYAEDIADRILACAPRRVIEIAAGTGVVTRALATRLAGRADIVATDLNQPMLDQAELRQGVAPQVSFRQADVGALPFEAASFDAAVCQFGVMFFPDKVAAHREVRRVLEPGSPYLLNVWDRIERNAFAATVTEALAQMFPESPPRFMIRMPHGYSDPARIRSDLEAAGFGAIAIEPIEGISHGRSAREVAYTYCHGTPMRTEIEERRPDGLDEATDHVADVLGRRFADGRTDSPIEGEIRALVVAATA